MNGRVQGRFKGEKGLHQGDPMLPLLFVLLMEYLTRSLQLAAQDSAFRISGCCSSAQGCSRGFQFCYWASISASKSHIYFGGVSAADRQRMAAELQLSEGSFPLNYLGVPMRPTKWKHEDCDIIIQKFRMRLHTWASRHLSFAGRIQLIHSILFGLRNY
ncbi:uncharacterized protein LOC133779293 [Humulus lupulus]|uniref:uncharacterized protein LOC133779293 n=1 Tax=Humulus lupulus TaxID=3486 RepID=UPI002B409593|nr:uncharacterized protein LOC133779293 [Humulus lupulus]